MYSFERSPSRSSLCCVHLCPLVKRDSGWHCKSTLASLVSRLVLATATYLPTD